MSSSGPGFPHDSTLPLLVAFMLALAFLGVVVAIGLSGGADGAPAAKTSTESLADTTPVEATPVVTLTLDTAGEGTGTVRVAGETRVCNAECRFRLDRDTSVTIIARAAPGSTFVSWTGECGGGRICTVLLDRSQTVTALFSRKLEAPEPSTSTKPDCEDKIDNDGDGFVDIEDDDCLLGSTEAPLDEDVPPPDDTTAPPVDPVAPPPVVVPPVVPPPPPPPAVIPP